jgi:hypothetical protein
MLFETLERGLFLTLVSIAGLPLNSSAGELPCCPVDWQIYSCPQDDGTVRLKCHNPQLGCPSSCTESTCDFDVVGVCGAFCPVVDPTGSCLEGCCGPGAVCVAGNCFGGPTVDSTDHECPVEDPIGPCVNGCCDEGAVCVAGNCFGVPSP